MSGTLTRLAAARRLEAAAVTAGAAAGYLPGGVDAAVLGAATGFFAAKSLGSLRRAFT
ncbi:hypothetical protein [Halobacterium yunchengense]|uniref:hypothetical protein n=1 Tax=Halobacterium yunchengense TaxID=3108497 RepID=UPI00300925B8